MLRHGRDKIITILKSTGSMAFLPKDPFNIPHIFTQTEKMKKGRGNEQKGMKTLFVYHTCNVW